MLAGMQQMSFIPGTGIEGFRPSVAPSYEDVVSGRDMVRYDRTPVRISEFRARVFDMMDEKQVAEYEDLMKRLIVGIQTSSCVIWRNDLQILGLQDGQHWMRSIEWAEYALNEGGSADRPAEGSVAPAGVISEVGGK